MKIESHECEVSDDADRILICPKCPYKAVIVGQIREILVPGDPTVAHWAVW